MRQIADKVNELLEEYNREVALTELEEIDSPIEKMMYIALKILSYTDYTGDPKSNYHLEIELQPDVQIGKKKYRPDFRVTMSQLIFADEFKRARYVCCYIECDGHEFHERTKEQAMNDRKKDRDFMIQGKNLFRFTGSELYRDSHSCALQVIKFLTKNLNNIPFKNL